jgi:hypothetical protein
VTRTPPKTALPRRLLLVLGGLLVGLCLAEIGMRLWAPPGVGFVLDATTSSFDPEMFEEDPVLLQRLRPSTRSTFESVAGRRSLRVNALGLRGPELGKKGTEEIRILALGDSFTLGLQVDELDTWSARLSEHLSSQVGTQVSVLNGGMVGYGTRQAAHRLGELAEITQADAAIILFYLGNDLRDNQRYPQLQQARLSPPPPGEVQPPPAMVHRGLRALARYSHLTAHGLAWLQMRDVRTDFRLVEYRDELQVFVDPAVLAEQLPMTQSALHELGRSCAQAAIPCMLVLAPPAYAVHTERLRPTLQAFGLDASQVDLSAPARAVTQATPRDLSVLDLTDSMASRSSSGPMYLSFDPHWSEAGHSAAASLMAPAITSWLTEQPQ